jgi:hypothetical protein
MKRLFILSFILIVFGACNTNDEYPHFNSEILPIDSVNIPTEFELGEVYPITVSYLRPTNCHAFDKLYYSKNTNQRTVAIIDYVFERDDCETLENEIVESTFNFIVNSNGSYIFKFWQGEDDQGEDQYLTIEVPVIE